MGYTPQKPNQNKGKRCPIMEINSDSYIYCLQDQCSFWIEIQKCCSIKLIATSLGNIDYREKLKRHIENPENLIEEI
jgi:hypothetical protein